MTKMLSYPIGAGPQPAARGRVAPSALALLLVAGAAGSARAYSNPNPSPTPISQVPGTVYQDEAITPIVLTPYTAAQCAGLPPSADTCTNQLWVKSCGDLYGATDPNSPTNPCTPLAHDKLAAWAAKRPLATGAKIYDPAIDDFTDSYKPVLQMGAVSKTGTKNTWATQEEKAKVTAYSNYFIPWLVAPQDYQRYSTVSSSVPVASCEQYVYRRYYELERWIDAMNACKNDARCIVRMSMFGMGPHSPSKVPGVLRRALKDSEGNPILDHVSFLYSKKKIGTPDVDPFTDSWQLPEDMPKNGFYSGTDAWISQSLIDGLKAGTNPDATCATDPTMPACQVQAMLNELHRGAKLSRIAADAPATSGGVYVDAQGNVRRGYHDEANFHWAMDKKTKDVSEGEFREYRRRVNALFAQLDLLADETKCMAAAQRFPGAACGKRIPNAIGKVGPGDTQLWQGDPLATRGVFGNVSLDQWVATPAMAGQIGVGSRLQNSTLDLGTIQLGNLSGGLDLVGDAMHVPGMVQLSAPAAGVAAPTLLKAAAIPGGGPGPTPGPPGPNVDGVAPFFDANTGMTAFNLKGVIDGLWRTNPPKLDPTSATVKLDCRVRTRVGRDGGPLNGGDAVGSLDGRLLVEDPTFHTEKVWKDVCELTNMLLEEWGRYQQGKGSCLDPKGFGCDWMPQDFVDRYVTQNIGYAGAAKEADYRECKRFTGGGDITSPDIAGKIGISAANRKSLTAINNVLFYRDDFWAKVMKNVPVKQQDDFGTVRTDSNHIGDGDFGGGYDYTLGWHLKVFKRYDAAAAAKDPDPPADPEHKYGWPCRVGGNLQAKFKAGAVLFGEDFNILDANGIISSNDADDAKAYVNAKLYVVGYDVFDTRDLDGASPNGDFDLTYALQKVYMDGGKPQLLELPFQVGPVTITVSAGIAYDYGVMIALSAGAAAKNSCSVSAVVFGAQATFTPFADLGVWVDADASIAGGLVGVGVEVDLTLVGLQLPFNVKLALAVEGNQIGLTFDARLDLVLTTLKGELDFYIKAFWIKVGSFTIVKWDGFSHKFPVFKTPHTLLPLAILPEGAISPPPVGTGGSSQM